MKKLSIYNVIGIICFVVWIITTLLQVINPHPYRGLIGNIVSVIGLILFYIDARIKKLKSPLYDPDKRKHIRNYIVLIVFCILTIIIVASFYMINVK